MRLLFYLGDTSVSYPDKRYPALEQFNIENTSKWSKDQKNSNKMVYSVKTARLSGGHLSRLSIQMCWVKLTKGN